MNGTSWKVGVIAATALLLAFGFHFRKEPAPPPAPVPTFDKLILPDLQGTPRSLGQWPQRYRLINFWAPWCAPCRDELPLLIRLYPWWSARNVQFVGIAMDTPESVTTFVKTHPLPYPDLIGRDDTLSLTKSLGNAQQGLPMTVLLDSMNQVVWVKLGRLEETELTRELTQLTSQAR
ncbi:TlpA disulfide reductase family protein [Ferrovum sp.]|uniref:TlpA family protein disulfide reductase n=1 Tax=Ferrovum sp. TaxID=2609467 RepID=UPI0026369488|nr:TlpA disulfide reductase family protein [Ferrovum sp.]